MNEVVLIGRLARDPELAYTQSNHARCTFTLAVDRPKSEGQDSGADFIRIIAWNRQAETCNRYLSKGSRCAVQGSIRTGSYTNQAGNKVYTTDVWATRVEFLETNQNNSRPSNPPQGRAVEGRQNAGYMPTQQTFEPMQKSFAPTQQSFTPVQQDVNAMFYDMPDTFNAVEDDIPF